MGELTYDRLSEEGIADGLRGLPGWVIDGGMLTRDFVFDSYSRGVVFAVACAQIAEALDHHPDLFIGYQKVRVAFITHSANGLTAYDFEAARRVQALA